MATRLLQRVRQTAHSVLKNQLAEETHRFFPRNRPLAVLACVSGGPDSKALLDVLLERCGCLFEFVCTFPATET
eukprot:46731-Amorphochlora_amoeboformis.AAC.1